MWATDCKSKTAVLVMVVAAVACILFCTFVALCPMGSLCESKNNSRMRTNRKYQH